MEFEIGAIFDGKVTGITKFGAFVALPGGRSGLVHISEVAYSYVNDVNEFLAVGQEVQVKVISVDENHRINLSIKQTLPPPPRPERPARRPGGDRGARSQNGERNFDRGSRPQQSGEHASNDRPRNNRSDNHSRPTTPKEPQSFEDMMKRYMSESERRQSELKRGNRISNRRSGRRSGGRGNSGGGSFYD